jgi:integrase/recombinase XerD
MAYDRITQNPRNYCLEENSRLLAHAADYQRPIIITVLNTAFRVGDILKLTWEQIDFTRRTITLIQTKTDQRIIQPMTDELIKAIKTIPRHVSSPYVFCDSQGRPYKRIVKGFTDACERAEIKGFRFHDLRHTFASYFIMRGGDLKTLQVLMGHKTIAMTTKYAHLAQEHLHQAIKRIDHLFGGNDDNRADRANGQ